MDQTLLMYRMHFTPELVHMFLALSVKSHACDQSTFSVSRAIAASANNAEQSDLTSLNSSGSCLFDFLGRGWGGTSAASSSIDMDLIWP